MTEKTESPCTHCEKTLSEVAQKAMYRPNNSREHHTCVACVEIGKQAGLSFNEIMVMSKEKYHRALKDRYEREARKVILFDPKRKLPKPKK